MDKLKLLLKKHGLFNFIYMLCTDFIEKEGLQRAGSLSYTVLMSFVPFFISIASITTFFLSKKIYSKLEKFILRNYLPSMSDEIIKYMDYFHKHSGQLSIVSFIFLFITSLMMISSLSHHLEKLWDIRRSHQPAGISLLINFILMSVGPLILGVTLVITSYLTSFIKIDYALVVNFLALIASIISFTMIYKFVPSIKVRSKYAFLAGLIAGVLFEIAKRGFTVYVKYFSTESILYGALATIPILLLWIYISCLILLICAHIIITIIKLQRQKLLELN